MREIMNEWECCYMAALQHFFTQDIPFLLGHKRTLFKQHFAFAAEYVFRQVSPFHAVGQRQFFA